MSPTHRPRRPAIVDPEPTVRVDPALYVVLVEREVTQEYGVPIPRHQSVRLPPFRLLKGKLKYPTVCVTFTDRSGNESAYDCTRATLK